MITETCYARAVQRRWSIDFKTVAQLCYLCAHRTQIVRDCRDAISLLHTQFLSLSNSRLSGGQCPRDRQNG